MNPSPGPADINAAVVADPLTAPNCDLSDFAFMPLDVARLRDSELASNETPEACWAAVLLWAASWHQVPAASIPNDDKWMAQQAGYGRVVKEWQRIRAGALRGWIECSDGRLYHPVVAEKAREAWQAKLEQRWRTECARIKKHNDRHECNVPKPSFDEWVSLGCPSGHMLPVPRDIDDPARDVPRETPSKGQGEGQGQGDSKKTHTEGEALPGGWVLPKAWGDSAIEEFPHWTPDTVRAVAKQFADHHRGKGTISHDWRASWGKWTRDPLTQRSHSPGRRTPAAAPAGESKTVPMSPAAVSAQEADAAERRRRAAEIDAIPPEVRAEKARALREHHGLLKAVA